MKSIEAPKLVDYVAGAAFSNSLAWLTLSLTSFFEIEGVALQQLLFASYFLGAIVAGYLVSRKALEEHLKVGLKTGIGAFVFHAYVFMGVFELLWGRRFLYLADHLLVLTILLAGSFVGSLLCRQFPFGKLGTTNSKKIVS